jgi:two-component system, cell cycle sensor histidine kinase and response regulator CckA
MVQWQQPNIGPLAFSVPVLATSPAVTFNSPGITAPLTWAASNRNREPRPRQSETILVIDDQDRVRTVTRMMLEAHGYRVLEADGGDSAMRIVEAMNSPIDLVLTDVIMPGLTGPQVAERLTARDANLLVVYMSGFTDDVVLRDGVLASEANFVQKPFTAAVLAKKVREALDARNR